MPLYDYRCRACGREIEVMHGIDARGPEACEACGGAMTKVLSPPAIHFKGSGWAKKDAAASSSKKAKSASTSSSSDDKKSTAEAKTGDKGSAEKPATTTETKTAAGTKSD